MIFGFILFSAFLLTANADTLRGVQQRELEVTKKVELGTAGDYAILTQSGISTVPNSVITGNIAVSPIAATAMTGFSLALADDGKTSTSMQVSGKAYGASYVAPTPALLTTAVGDMAIAYTDAAGRLNSNATKINLNLGVIGGLTLYSREAYGDDGVYTFQSGVTINSDVTFDGSDTDIFIIQMTGNLVVAAGMEVKLAGGAKAENIFWQVAGNVKVMVGAHMEGILLVKTDVLFMTGSSLNGRILAQTAAVLQMATITEPPPPTIPIDIDLPATNTNTLFHGICAGGSSSLSATSSDSSLTYTAMDQFIDTTKAWGDLDYTIYGIENTPCAGGILLQPSLAEDVQVGTSITITADENSSVCVFIEGDPARAGGWGASLQDEGFTVLFKDFGWVAKVAQGGTGKSRTFHLILLCKNV